MGEQDPSDQVDRLYRAALALTGDRPAAEALVLETDMRVRARSRYVSADDFGYRMRVLMGRHRKRGGATDAVREAVVAVDVAGLSPSAAAAVLRMPEDTVRAHLEQGREPPADTEPVSAPLALRDALERRRETQRTYPTRRSLLAIGAILAVAATAAGFLAPSGPTVQKVAAVAINGPERDPTAPAVAGIAGEGYVYAGARTDRVGGRTVRTVIYRRGADEVHYATVSGRPLRLPGGRRLRAGKLRLARATVGGVDVVAFHKGGKTIVIASRTLDADALAARLR